MHYNNRHEQYAELVALTQLFLMQEYPLDKRIPAEPAAFEYFKQYAIKQRQQAQNLPNPPANATPIERSPSPPVAIAAPQIQPPKPTPPTPIQAAPQPAPTKPAQKMDPVPTPPIIPKVEAPPAPKTSEKKKSGGLLELQPMEPPSPADFTEMRLLVNEHFPSFVLLDNVPDDSLAKQLMSGWKQQMQSPGVMILTFNEPEKHQNFISNVTKAIQLSLSPAQMIPADKIEKDKDWDRLLQSPDLRLILASDYGIYALPELMKYYKEDSRNAKRYLGKVPLLLLPDVSVYLKEPALKSSLWRALCEILSPR